jgi:hypothetical protein
MTICVVSAKAAIRYFARLRRSRRYPVIKISPKRLAEFDDWKDRPDRCFFYLHALSFADTSGQTVGLDVLVDEVDALSRTHGGRVGVFDPEGIVGDPARLFFAGAADYLSPGMLAVGMTDARIAEALLHARAHAGAAVAHGRRTEAERMLKPVELVRAADPLPPPREIRSGSDWSKVRPGREYTFWFLHVAMEGGRRYAAGASDATASHVYERFREYVVSEVDRFGGRLWMWKPYGGLLLFPFDGERCSPIIPSFRLVMNRVIANSEQYRVKSPISYRLALHLGNTIYRSHGKTGEVVSEDVNFIFHLAEQFTATSEMTVTELALSYVPEGLYSYFVPKGLFEGHAVYRMRHIK